MPDLEIMIFNKKLKLSYQDKEKHRLVKAVENLNERWNNLSNLHGKVSDLKIVTLISLELQDLIEDFESLKLKNKKSDENIQILKKELKKSIETKNKFDEDLKQKNNEISKIEAALDDINDELLQIKNNLLKPNE